MKTSLGHRVYYFRTVTSTQDEAKRLAEAGAPEGTVVLAEEQTAGRGRLGRTWISPVGSSILMSVIFRPPLLPQQAHRLTMIASLSIAEAIESLTPLKVKIKWPNDILIAGKKAGGILTEIRALEDRILYAIVGVGLNVNVKISDSPLSPLAPYATSLSDELGYELPRFTLLQEILLRLEENYRELRKGRDFRGDWLARLYPLGQEISVITPTGILEGVAIDINEDGALLLATPEGEVKTVWAGDVTIKKEVKHEEKDNP
ncbi:MAG: biotin--[acetyl-CoA-carboxylase] ligase [Anaerolineae bacterium]|nr:biotin--[acetyl-CoA-carboxylase] ligase [Anaerolineae bacterium]MDW8102865.1 biotin--[acetyl-CoA-carboxylase] ligase [Anaerolineae bacterium]